MNATLRLAASYDTAAVQDAIRDAAATRTPLRLVGRGTWLDAGRPVGAAVTLPLGALQGIVDYTPSDLTLTALAGTPLLLLDRVTRAEGQWLGADPFGAAEGTLGATVATASAGPLAHAFGLPRDNVLGLEFVTGAGAVVRAGGRVVKNVAGFDLVRLLVGSWGTLGAITEVSVRLRALPAVDTTVALPLPAGDASRREWLAALRRAPLAALALELVSAPLAAYLGMGSDDVLLARLAGNEELVAAQRRTLAALGDCAAAPADAWRRLRSCEPSGAAVVRFSHLPSRLADTWAHALAVAAPFAGAMVHASVGRGVARCILPSDDSIAIATSLGGSAFDGTMIAERLPAPLWPVCAPSVVAGRLSRGVRHAYDPHGILNPGILDEDSMGSVDRLASRAPRPALDEPR